MTFVMFDLLDDLGHLDDLLAGQRRLSASNLDERFPPSLLDLVELVPDLSCRHESV